MTGPALLIQVVLALPLDRLAPGRSAPRSALASAHKSETLFAREPRREKVRFRLHER